MEQGKIAKGVKDKPETAEEAQARKRKKVTEVMAKMPDDGYTPDQLAAALDRAGCLK